MMVETERISSFLDLAVSLSDEEGYEMEALDIRLAGVKEEEVITMELLYQTDHERPVRAYIENEVAGSIEEEYFALGSFLEQEFSDASVDYSEDYLWR